MKQVKNIRYFRWIALSMIVAFSLQLSSCITNDIPYPVEELTISNIEGEGFVMQTPDYNNRTITLTLDETTDISNVKITTVDYSSDAELSSSLIGTFDLRTPLSVVLSLYQDYEWTICAEQNIERYFKVSGQIGEEEIDAENLTAKVYVSQSTDLTNISIKELKLGPEDITTMSPSIEDITYFESYRSVKVSYHSFEQTWRLYVESTDVVIDLTKCDVWAKRAYLAAAGDSSGECGFRYRVQGSEKWIEFSDDVDRSEGSFYATLTGLETETVYEFKAFSGDDESEITTISTEQTRELENGGLEEWSQPSNAWLPYSDSEYRFWDSGNTGATLLGSSYNLTTPCEDTCPETTGSLSAQLASTKVTAKFAAGNLFVGQFVKIAGTNGIVGFGQPFTQRPTALRGWVKYNCGVIDMISENPPGENFVAGESYDTGIIYIAMGTWTPEEYGVSTYESDMLGTEQTPIIVDTRDKATFFNPYSDAVISYGELLLSQTQSEWMEFIIPLEYTTTSVVPTHLVIVASASRYGDYFTGSTSSTMWLDDLELIYE